MYTVPVVFFRKKQKNRLVDFLVFITHWLSGLLQKTAGHKQGG